MITTDAPFKMVFTISPAWNLFRDTTLETTHECLFFSSHPDIYRYIIPIDSECESGFYQKFNGLSIQHFSTLMLRIHNELHNQVGDSFAWSVGAHMFERLPKEHAYIDGNRQILKMLSEGHIPTKEEIEKLDLMESLQ